MATNESTRGGTHEQHVKAGQQSHQNVQDSEINDPSSNSGEGRGWHGDPEGHAEAGRKGGEAVSQDREHMAEIGRKGGEAVSEDRGHMAEIGRKGGEARGNENGNDDDTTGNRGAKSQGGTHEQHVAAGKQSHKKD